MRAFVTRVLLVLIAESSASGPTASSDRPWNSAVIIGQPNRMRCKPENLSKIFAWTIHRPFNSERNIWTNWKNDAKVLDFTFLFDIEDDGSVTLGSNSTQLNDAGIYTCLVDKTPRQPERYSAQLIVLESDPKCNTNISIKDGTIKEFDYIEFECAVNFSGHWTPTMQWSKDGKVLNESLQVEDKTISKDVQQLVSVFILQVKPEDNDGLVACKTVFVETSASERVTNATNVPDYLFYWNTTLNVLFGPKNVTITPKKDTYQRSDVLSCTAVGRPSPSFTWRRAEEILAEGTQLDMNNAGLDYNERHVIECIARNHVNQSSVTIEIIITGNSSKIMHILTGMICVILMLIIIAISRNRIQGWIVKMPSLCRRGLALEPDILPNVDEIRNGEASNNEIDPYGHYAVPAEIMALGHDQRQRIENAVENRAEEEGSASSRFDGKMEDKFPVYSQINKTKNKAVSGCNTYTWSSGVVPRNPPASANIKNTGLDGTVYAEMKPDGGVYPVQASGSLLRNPMFNRSEYAIIDHTLEPPPPPRRK